MIVKILLSLFFVSYNVNYVISQIPDKYSVYWYNQKIDHFNYVRTDTFKQKVIVSTDHWCNDSCPIFFYAGNEGDILAFANNTGFMWENAPKFKAMVIFAEHRYYGESLPFGNDSFKGIDKSGYLTIEQALADYAELIQDIKLNIPNARKSPVVMFGGSYGGMLAAWFRMKYPHLVVGSLAASAPILQFPGLYDCRQYNDIASKNYRDYSEQCFLSIKKSWDAITNVGSTADGRNWLTKTFKLCFPIETDKDLNEFSDWLENTWGELAMIDYPNPTSFLEPLPAYPIKVVCSHLSNSNQDDKNLLQDIYRAVSVYFNYTGQRSCYDFRDNSDGGILGDFAWGFQSCTETVIPLCSIGNDTMFRIEEWDIKKVSAECLENYGVKPDEHKATLMFGGYNIKAASNIIFSNGARDPWSAGGVLETLAESLPAIIIPHACHHEDLRSTSPNDPVTLIQARQKEVGIIKGWIEKYYESIGYWPVEWSESSNLI